MKILLLTQWFQPEPMYKGLPLAKELSRRGHKVEVLTGFPNYPGGKVYPGYRIRPWMRETIEGIPVVRVALYPSHDKCKIRRILNYATFALSASIAGCTLMKRPDIIYAYHPPATVGLPALVMKTYHRVPVVYDIQDLWPDTLAATGMLNCAPLLSMLDRLCRVLYRQMDRVVVLSPGFRSVLMKRGIPGEQIEVIYNWCDEEHMSASQQPNGNVVTRNTGEFSVVFAGTMGVAQGLDAVLDAARICRTAVPNVRFQFIGGGVDRERLERKAGEMALDNVTFMPRQPMTLMGPILGASDVLLVHLKDAPLFRITIPSKTQAYFVAGKPVLMAVLGDSAELVRDARAGVVVQPENGVAIAKAVQQLSALTAEQRAEMGENGRRYYQAHMSLKAGVDRFENIFQSLVNRARSGPQNGLARCPNSGITKI